MRGRWMYGLIGVFVVIMLGILIAEGRPQPPQLPEEVIPLTRLFPEIDIPQRIIGMELTLAAENRQIAVVVEEDQQTWRLREAPFSPVDAAQADDARKLLGSLPTAGTIRASDVAEIDFGFLPNPYYVVRFQLEDLSVATLLVGNKNPEGDLYYVSSEPNGAIVDLVPVEWLDTFVFLMTTLEPVSEQADATPTLVPR